MSCIAAGSREGKVAVATAGINVRCLRLLAHEDAEVRAAVRQVMVSFV
jgi:hypothetical protein